MTHIGLILLLGLLSVSERDQNDGIMFLQSRITPKVFEICKAASPDASAGYDEVFEKWLKKNRRSVAHGEQVMRDAAKTERMDFETEMQKATDGATSQLKSESAEAQAKHCQHMLDVTKSEL